MDISTRFLIDVDHPIECVIHLKNSIYMLKESGIVWFENLKDILGYRGFSISSVSLCILRDKIVLLFYVNDCLMLSPSNDNIDSVCASLQIGFKIGDDGNLNKYILVEPDCLPG